MSKIYEFNEYSSNEFVVNVTDVLIQNDKYIFVDEGLSKIIMMDEDLKSPVFVGKRGHGPEELMSPTLLYTAGDKLYVYDEDKMKILEVDISKGRVSNEMTIGLPLLGNNGFVNKSILYFTTPVEPIVEIQKFDLLKGTKMEGIELPANSAKSTFGRHIFSVNDGFITVTSYNTPVIEKYDKEWSLIDGYSLEDIPLIKRRMEYQAPSNLKMEGGTAKRTASARITVSCARMHDGTLYLLIYTLGDDLKSRRNTILKFKYERNSWQQSGRLLLPEMGDYSTFNLQEGKNQLIAFERTSRTVEVFKIND
jgi:hypothetical protein